MKKNIIACLALILLGITTSNAQSVNTKKDEFTGAELKESSWEKLYQDFSDVIRFKFMSVNKSLCLNLKIIAGGSSFHINQGDKLYLKYSDDSVVELICGESAITEIGGGAIGLNGSGVFGISVLYPFKQLPNAELCKIRIVTSRGYLDYDISKKKADLFDKTLKNIM